ncbi:MAG: phosphodiester glycosidase family protein [Oscillospiraceae bacterium]|nr:phosphodiester glycosidase family protein [Oscillospiraceae bacterium]
MSTSDSRRARRAAGPVRRVLSFLAVTLLCLLLILLGVVWVMEKGPSPTATGMFCRSVRETSAIRWVSGIFLSPEELEAYKSVSTEDLDTAQINTDLIHLSAATMPESRDVELLDIAEGTCKGKLLIVHDPTQVFLGTSDNYGTEPGLPLTEMVAKYGAAAGINAGGFEDEGGRGNGSLPSGLVIANGQILWGSPSGRYNLVGLDWDGILHVGAVTGQEALDLGVRWGVSFVTHDGLASALIINGEVQRQNLGGGINPRTAIGQRADGALLLLVLDGRSIDTLGATMEDVCDILLEYGAVNAGNLDGGSSSAMVYHGETINNSASIVGPRKLPTAFLVMEGGDDLG